MRPRDMAGTVVTHTHSVQATCDRSQDRLHAKEEAAVIFRKPTLCSGLTEAKRSFGFLLWGGNAHLHQMKKEKKPECVSNSVVKLYCFFLQNFLH